jgi:hypothetical protein
MNVGVPGNSKRPISNKLKRHSTQFPTKELFPIKDIEECQSKEKKKFTRKNEAHYFYYKTRMMTVWLKRQKKILEILMETNEEEKFILFLCFPPYNEIIIILKLLLMLLPFAFSCLRYINLLLILRVNETFSLLNWPILNCPFAFLGQNSWKI